MAAHKAGARGRKGRRVIQEEEEHGGGRRQQDVHWRDDELSLATLGREQTGEGKVEY